MNDEIVKTDIEMENEEIDVNEIYTPLSVAKEEIWRRWNDVDLRKKVEEYLGGDVPDVFKDEPRAIFFRNIATPNFESRFFFDLAHCVELAPAYLEFGSDKFCTRNADKLCLAKLAFFDKLNKNGEAIIHYEKIIDIKTNDNEKFCDIKTLLGEGLIDFHHNLIKDNIVDEIELFDMSAWIDRNGHNAIEYYKKFLAFFICYGILFENFIVANDHYEKKFTKEVVMPVINEIERVFGLKPLIVPLLPIREESDQEWMWYPKLFNKYVNGGNE